MSTYYYVVNMTKQVWFNGHTFDEGAKLYESISHGMAARALIAMMTSAWRDDVVCIRDEHEFDEKYDTWPEVNREELLAAMEDKGLKK